MIEIQEAVNLIQRHSQALGAEQVDLSRAVGHVLYQPVASDIDSPPFDKSMMDGFAVISEDIEGGQTELEIVDRVLAGTSSKHTLRSGQAIQIMTGAPIPNGADAVMMIEQTSHSNKNGREFVIVNTEECRPGQNILKQRATMAAGEIIMQRGARIRAEDIGLLAEAGVATCLVHRKPNLAVIATGDELVPPDQPPAADQIRNSNGPMLAAMARPLCGEVTDLGIATDDRETLTRLIQQGLERDALVLSGGVSAGLADMVPSVLADLGVQHVFHSVSIKPGKPLWFGILSRIGSTNTLVFGLPGNPVSSMVCFHVFVAPALRRLSGLNHATNYSMAELTSAHSQRVGRTTYWPSNLQSSEQGWTVEPLNWKGSADLKTLAEANSFAVFPGDRGEFSAGERVDVLRID